MKSENLKKVSRKTRNFLEFSGENLVENHKILKYMVAMDIRLLVQVEFEVFGHVQGEKTLAFHM